MIWWTSLAPREFEFTFPGSLTSASGLQAGFREDGQLVVDLLVRAIALLASIGDTSALAQGTPPPNPIDPIYPIYPVVLFIL